VRDVANGEILDKYAVLGAISLAHHPRPDVRGTIAKGNTSSSLVLSQATDGVAIGEDQIREIQDNDATSRLVVDELAQFVHIVRVKSTADREHNRSAAGAMNFQHRPVAANAITRPCGSSPKNSLALACESGFY